MVCLQSLHSVGVVTISISFWLLYYALYFVLLNIFCSVQYPFWFVSFGRFPILLYVILVFAKSILHIILHGYYVLLFLIYDIYMLIICYHVCISYCPYNVCPCGIIHFPSFIFSVPISWFTYPPVSLFPNCVAFIHDWMKTFGGCMHMCFTTLLCKAVCSIRKV